MEKEIARILARIGEQKNDWDKKDNIENKNCLIIIALALVMVALFMSMIIIISEGNLKSTDLSTLISLVSLAVACMALFRGELKNKEYFIVHKIENKVNLEVLITELQKRSLHELIKKSYKFTIKDVESFENQSETYLKIYYIVD